MIRRLIALVTAASVLCHGVVGCCAHHTHPTIAGHDVGALSGQCCHVDAGSACKQLDRRASHQHAHAGDVCGTDSHEEWPPVDFDDHQRDGDPCGGPKECTDGQCAFAATVVASALKIDRLDAGGLSLDCVLCDTGPVAASPFGQHQLNEGPPFSSHGLRRHLALGVLLI